jgi:hypothetical protein
MSIETRAVCLAGRDSDARLVFEKDVLLGVVTRLGPDHGVGEGRWYVEAVFGLSALKQTSVMFGADQTFPDLDAVRGYFARVAQPDSIEEGA